MKAVLISGTNLLVAILLLWSVWSFNLILPIMLASYMVGHQVVTLIYDVSDLMEKQRLIKRVKELGQVLESRHNISNKDMD